MRFGHRLQKLSRSEYFVAVPQDVTVPKHQLAFVDHWHFGFGHEVGNCALHSQVHGQRSPIQRQFERRPSRPVLMHPRVPSSHQIFAGLAMLGIVGVNIC